MCENLRLNGKEIGLSLSGTSLYPLNPPPNLNQKAIKIGMFLTEAKHDDGQSFFLFSLFVFAFSSHLLRCSIFFSSFLLLFLFLLPVSLA